MGERSGGQRDFAAMRRRRRRAARLFAAGKLTQAEIAHELNVSRQSVSRWYEAWASEDAEWIAGAGRAGRPPKLDAAQLKAVDKTLRQGARAFGFGTDLWTLPRVSAVIEGVTGVRYHPGHVWRLLRQMNWSLQRPAKQARERDEAARKRWVADRWPAVKKTPGAAEPGSSSRTKVGSRNARR